MTSGPLPDRPPDQPADRRSDQPADRPPDQPADRPPDQPADRPPDQPADQSADRSGTGQRWSRLAVIGDVGGHLDELTAELVRLGADPATGELPPDLQVIQVGDLVHRGPDSAGVVRLVDRVLRAQPGQWIQLVGNHEAQYLAAPTFSWPDRLPEDAARRIRGWWSDGLMRVAATVAVDDEDVLITHAGLTDGFWRRVLGAPVSAGRVVELLNAMRGTREDLLFRPGQMLGGGRPNPTAGPIWASAAAELVPGWLHGWLPFSQIHGHTSLYRWDEGTYGVGAEISDRTVLDHRARHETTTLSGGRIIGVDPGHGSAAGRTWRSWSAGPAPAQPAAGSDR